MSAILIAGCHRYPDLARLWYGSVTRVLLPALEHARLDLQIAIYCDPGIEPFDAADFPSARLVGPTPRARDFIEFYDSALDEDCDYLLLLDADVFLLDGTWVNGYREHFDDPRVAAVSFLHRAELPGAIYALLCRATDFRRLPRPVFAPRYEDVGDWPSATHRDPGQTAASRLQSRGKRIVRARDCDTNVADFHGTTNLRRSRELIGSVIGDDAFVQLVAEKSYFIKGAYDNLLLGQLYGALFGGDFAVDQDGVPFAGSMTPADLDRALERVRDPARLRDIAAYCRRSDACMERLATCHGVGFSRPRLAAL